MSGPPIELDKDPTSPHASQTNASQNNDTFLSRVFGLNSVYNQLHDNYQYYDPDAESNTSQAFSRQLDSQALRQELPSVLEGSILNPDATGSRPAMGPRAASHPLLDSESDSDLSSSPSPSISEIPRVQESVSKRKSAGSNQNANSNNINWNVPNAYNGDSRDDAENSGADEQDDLLTSLSKPKERRLKFNIPNPRDYFNRKQKQQNQPTLPLFNTTTGSSSASAQHQESYRKPPRPEEAPKAKQPRSKFVIPPKERALYWWANIINMDYFLTILYDYYREKGLFNMIAARIVDLIVLVFMLSFTVFLKWGINYSYFYEHFETRTQVTLKDLVIPNFFMAEVPLFVKFLLLGFLSYVVMIMRQLYVEYYVLREMQNFYVQLIGISSDSELMTISWKTIVERLMLLKDYNTLTSSNEPHAPDHSLFQDDLTSKVRLNAHDIANRIMRKQNYMIALMNKEVLDLSLNFPFNTISLFNSKSVLTKNLEFNLTVCIYNFVFNQHGQINPEILKESHRNQLSRDLNRRIKTAALLNLIFSPFIVIYFVLLYFFRYFNEYKSNPSSLLGLRQYTPYALWKLREFNELPHFFAKRLNLSIGPANTYINQFPRGVLIVHSMFLVHFISGAFLAILVIMGLWFEDEEHSFWSFEITEGKSSFFYISLFGTLWAITSNSIDTPNSNSSDNASTNSSSFVYDPEASLRYVSQFTHYLPSSWNGRLHTMAVKNEFCDLYSLKIVLIINEILSFILSPYILWFKVSANSGAIIDFFRDYSVHVDGLGYVCYYAMFNFEEKDKNMMYDLNKKKDRRKKRARRRESQPETSTATATAGIELDTIKPTRTDKKVPEPIQIQNNSDTSDADESDTDLGNDNYQDEKMVRSYMYFLESYGGTNANAKAAKPSPRQYPANNYSQAQNLRNTNNIKSINNANVTISQSQFDPSPSLMYQDTVDPLSHSLSDSTYNINYKFDEPDQPEFATRGKKSGVLGMLNQYYKQKVDR